MFGRFLSIVGILASTVVVLTTATFHVQHIGKSGKVVLQPYGAEDGRYVEMSLEGIEELTPQRTPIGWKTPNIASQSFAWSEPKTIFIGHQSATEVQLSSSMNVGGNSGRNGQIAFNLTTLIAETDIVVPYGNETVMVPRASLKWTINLGPWPWKNNHSDNLLAFSVSMRSHSYGQATVANDVVKLPDGVFMNLETTAIIDGSKESVGYEARETSGRNIVTFTFPHYGKSVEYDPVMGITSRDESSSLGCSASLLMSYLSIFAIVFTV